MSSIEENKRTYSWAQGGQTPGEALPIIDGLGNQLSDTGSIDVALSRWYVRYMWFLQGTVPHQPDVTGDTGG